MSKLKKEFIIKEIQHQSSYFFDKDKKNDMHLPNSFREYAYYCYRTNNTSALFSNLHSLISVQWESWRCRVMSVSNSVNHCWCVTASNADRGSFRDSKRTGRGSPYGCTVGLHSGSQAVLDSRKDRSQMEEEMMNAIRVWKRATVDSSSDQLRSRSRIP